jgi:hypothetical protein
MISSAGFPPSNREAETGCEMLLATAQRGLLLRSLAEGTGGLVNRSTKTGGGKGRDLTGVHKCFPAGMAILRAGRIAIVTLCQVRQLLERMFTKWWRILLRPRRLEVSCFGLPHATSSTGSLARWRFYLFAVGNMPHLKRNDIGAMTLWSDHARDYQSGNENETRKAPSVALCSHAFRKCGTGNAPSYDGAFGDLGFER